MEGQPGVSVMGGNAPSRLGDATSHAGRKPYRLSPALRRVFMTTLSLVMVLAIWQLLSVTVFNRHLVPAPLTVVETAAPMLMSGEILQHIGISLVRILIGFILGTVLA